MKFRDHPDENPVTAKEALEKPHDVNVTDHGITILDTKLHV